jgi:large subunit ribosomal protein L22
MANHNERKARHEAENDARRAREFSAAHRFARIAATKVRLVADQVRGLSISKALETLKFSKKRGGAMLKKVIESALANAQAQISERKLDIDIDDLYVAHVRADKGPMLKRWMTRARGMAYPILRRYCHIHATLRPRGGGGEEKAAPGKAAAKEEGAGAGSGSEKKASKRAMAGAR